ncbi:MAG: pentapeptide repeat-containing protein [Candidatus Scalindua sp.]|jgi:hypothetical protein|nr:pentapeptide repeat-containing protein [Candidatus Scalindua sp.]MBT6228639.1 pentapeptide repeat-containing protein [Candidatus Scalindua sp.]
MKISIKTLSFIVFIPLLLLIFPLHSQAVEEASTRFLFPLQSPAEEEEPVQKDIQILIDDEVIKVSREDIKERIYNEEPVHFIEKQEEAKRTIQSVWITRILRRESDIGKIDIKNAIITGSFGSLPDDSSGWTKILKTFAAGSRIRIYPSIHIINSLIKDDVLVVSPFRVTFEKDVDFTDTIFMEEVNFESAIFKGKKLFIGTKFENGINFRNVNLIGINLRDAILHGVNLNGSDLTGVDLSKTVFVNADFSQSKFDPAKTGVNILLGARGLSSIKFEDIEEVVTFRDKARTAGFRYQERQLTAALRKKRFHTSSFSEHIFQNLFINYPTDYGANPWRSLGIFGALLLIFTLPYSIAIETKGDDGIWKVWSRERLRTDLGTGVKERELIYRRGLPVLVYSFYFSILSAFHIGWRDLNVGSWITRIQPQEYTMKATGWVRIASGSHSLLSIYLLALWVLTYFGRPFE